MPTPVNEAGSHRPLHEAAYYGDETLVRLLIGNGADVTVKDRRGSTPLHKAAESGQKVVVQLLLDHKADINAKDNWGWTALHMAAKNGHKTMVWLLLVNGADVTIKHWRGSTPLHEAVESGQEAVVRLLLDHKADVNAKLYYSGWMALHLAAGHGHEVIVQQLLDSGAYVNAGDREKRTAVHMAAQNGHEAVVRLLLDNKAEVDAKMDYTRWTPLHVAADYGREAIVRLLLDSKADVNAKDIYGWTALQYAAKNGYEQVERTLLSSVPAGVHAAAARTRPVYSLLNKSGDLISTNDKSSCTLEKRLSSIEATFATGSKDIDPYSQPSLEIQRRTALSPVSHDGRNHGGNRKKTNLPVHRRPAQKTERLLQPNTTSRICVTCTETLPISEFPAIMNCDHDSKICADCYKRWIAAELERKCWNQIKCPDSDCKQLLKHAEVQQYASPEICVK